MWLSDLPRARPLHATLLLVLLLVLCVPVFAQSASIVVVTAADGPLTELDRSTTEQLYLGRRGSLFQGQGVLLVDLPSGPVRDEFYLRLTRKNPSQIRAYWSRLVFTGRAQPPREAASTDDARRIVLQTPGAVAYLPRAEADDPALRILFSLD